MFDPVSVSRLAEIRYDEMLEQAERQRRARWFRGEGPGLLARVWRGVKGRRWPSISMKVSGAMSKRENPL